MSSKTDTSTASPLSIDDKIFFIENGYSRAFALSDRAALNKLKQAIEQQQWLKLRNQLLHKTSDNDFFPAKTAYLSSQLVCDLATESAILEGVADLLGPDLLLWVGETITRAPFNSGQQWHIDATNAFVGGIHASIAITDMNMKNGCLRVIPKTHTYGVDPWHLAKKGECDLSDDASLLRLADRLHPENAPHSVEPVEVSSGEVFLTKGGLWHSVGPNHTLKTRMAMVARYAQPQVKVTYPLGRKIPCILVRGEDRYGLNQLYPRPTDN